MYIFQLDMICKIGVNDHMNVLYCFNSLRVEDLFLSKYRLIIMRLSYFFFNICHNLT